MTAVDYINDPARLQAIAREALKCMDEGRYGDARRWLTHGTDKPVRSHTGVLAKDAYR
jgi:hypothetical protein